MGLFEPTPSGAIFRRGCCRKTQLCEQDDNECRSRFPKAFVSSAGILNLPITSLPVDNFTDRALWCKPTGINYNIHGWILCRYCATGWFWWIRGLRAVTMWSSSSFRASQKQYDTYLTRKHTISSIFTSRNRIRGSCLCQGSILALYIYMYIYVYIYIFSLQFIKMAEFEVLLLFWVWILGFWVLGFWIDTVPNAVTVTKIWKSQCGIMSDIGFLRNIWNTRMAA